MVSIERSGVPTYEVEEYGPKLSAVALVIPVLNERHRLENQLKGLQAYRNIIDIIIADGGSTDGSVSKGILNSNSIRTLLKKLGPGRLSAQLRMAFDYCLDQGYSGVILIDGNNKDVPAAIPHFVRMLKDGFDHIQGSRFMPGGSHKNTPRCREWAIKLIHAPIVSLASGFRYSDTTNGFRAYSSKLIGDPRVGVFRSVFSEYELHFYLAIRAPQLNFQVAEIPVQRNYPDDGSVPTKIKGLRGWFKILKGLILAATGRYNL